MPVAVFASATDDPAQWLPALRAAMPALEVRVWPEIGDPAEIDYAIVWKPPAGMLAGLPNLKVIYSLGAGIDTMLRDPALPAEVPLVRMVDLSLTEGMVEFVAEQVLAIHRQARTYRAQQAAGVWEQHDQRLARDVTVGILGLGTLGSAAARVLQALNFRVAGWSRTPKAVEGVEGFAGAAQLDAFLAQSEILVCLLPLTAETENILDRRLFAALPRGAWVINAGRGHQLVDADLIAALDSGHLAGAVLDVFRTEPLPADHPFWTHPKVVLTPHVAANNNATYATLRLAEQIARFERGEPMQDVVDRSRGY
ncbi:MAG: 2-hydroxyacid dehydrogenase [Inquilinus sp.]|uniref:2-hydroxyacid dehydrogenase n=1 Tax=Inquilinus sp. TaxID=1932117 RepID=UPI003F2A4259